MEAEIMSYIVNNGVAIGMLAYFVFRFEKILKDNTDALQNLCEKIANCPKKS